ncbi:molybdopterin-dependent oxidoreductase [Pseudomonadales bacterium]|nr:molybdopterin-dependent oxidoreductase [Pseudomonadales bacterium]
MSRLPADPSRRTFLRSSSMLATGSLLVGFELPYSLASAPKASSAASLMTDAFIRIDRDNTITVLMNHAEFGNGVYTSLAMMVAEELDIDWQRLRWEAAPTEPRYYSPIFGEYLTAGSVSTAGAFMPMRTAGAKTKALLLQAAGILWQTDANQLSTDAGWIAHADGRRVSYGGLINVIQDHNLEPPKTVDLKPASAFSVLGFPKKRIEAPEKVTGRAIFGIDIKRPGMIYGAVARPPVYGSRVIAFDDKAARAIPGVLKVKAIDAGVVVLAKDYWTASKGAKALTVQWDDLGLGQLSTASFTEEYRALSKTDGLLAEDIGDAKAVHEAASAVHEAVYEMPYLAHATMEPMNCTAQVFDDRCEIWVGTQNQGNDRTVVAKMLGLPETSVVINRTLMGGTFGRRASKTADFITDAVQAAQGETVPVQIIWSREEDIRGGHYRPLFVHRLRGTVDAEGYPASWHQTVVGQSIMQHTKHDPTYMVRGIDIYSVDGCLQEPFGVFPYGTAYQIPNHRVESHNPPKIGVRPHEWRAVGHTHTGVAYECFLDELAHLGDKDPLALRLHLTRDNDRMHQLLLRLKEAADWDQPLAAGRGRGMAARVYSVSPIAQAVEVTVALDGTFTVDRVVCVVDCGFAVNPLGIEAQIQGGVMLGLNAVAYGGIDLVDGQVQQSNFHDVRALRFNQMPAVEVHIMQSDAPPTGVGEQATTPIAPAVANALFHATGKRIRQFPLDRHGFTLKA